MNLLNIGKEKEFAKKIFEYRKALGMSQAQLAEKIGVSRNTIINYESGKRTPDLGTMFKIISVLDFEYGKNAGKKQALKEATTVELFSPLRDDILSIYERLNDLGKEEAIRYLRILSKVDEFTTKEVTEDDEAK